LIQEVEKIPIKKLEIDPMNIRGDVSVDEEFVNDIEENGIRTPLTVRSYDGKYGIVAGSRRYTGAINAGLDAIPCVVKEMSDAEARAESIAENKHREDIPAARWNEVINELAEEIDGSLSKTKKVEKISRMTGMSKTSIKDYLSIGELPPDIQARLKKPSERSESETKQIEAMSLVSDEGVPKNVMREIARDEDFKEWTMEEPEKAHKVLSFAAKKGQNRVGDVLESVKVEPNLEPEEAYKKTKVEVSKPIKIEISFGSKMNKAIEQYVADAGLADREEAIKDIVKDFLRRKGYL